MNIMLQKMITQMLNIIAFYRKNPKALDLDCPAANIWKSHLDGRLTEQNSRPLSVSELDLAKRLGVKHPEQVIVCDYASTIKGLAGYAENKVVQMLNICTELPAEGITAGYTIGMRNYMKPNLQHLAHELVHVTQYEKLNDFGAYMKAYLSLFPGSDIISYMNHPMEIEANQAM